jgi:prepilin peptidase CpaA
VGLGALLPFFLLGMMGAADVKVFAVLGAWCGMHPLLNLWLIASIAAGVHALWLLIVTRTRVGVLLKRGSSTFALAGRRSSPFAAFLTVPTILWLASQVMTGGIR